MGNGKEEIEITLEDQKQINTFARRNARMEELKEEIETKKVCYRSFRGWCQVHLGGPDRKVCKLCTWNFKNVIVLKIYMEIMELLEYTLPESMSLCLAVKA